MAISNRQKVIAADMIIYAVLSKMMDEGDCDDPDEAEVIEEVTQMINAKVKKYDVFPDGGLPEIVAYVKEHY